VEARRTRNEGRVRRLEQLRRERDERRERVGSVNLQLSAAERSGRLVAELEDVSKHFGPRCIVQGLSLRLMRGDRLALIGPNGAGKSTLIKMILGQIAPDSGVVRNGTRLNVAVFDQHRDALDPERTLAQTIAPGSDWIEVGGSRKHVLSYLGDFLFPARRADAPVRTLSGGERNRLLLARLFAQSANLLVLDEPTNDLDMETLELLEATLADYTGTLLLVSHDRRFLDSIATQSLVAEGDGRWREYVGGYSDWQRQRAAAPAAAPVAAPGESRAASAGRSKARADKLGFKERRELEALPAQIQALELEQAAIHARLQQPDYHRQGPEQLRADAARLQEVEQALEASLERWVALEARAN